MMKALLEDEILEYIKDLLNDWWRDEKTPVELTQARVASIYKKGNTELQENYHKSITLQESLTLAVKVLKQVMEEKLNASNIQLATKFSCGPR